MSPDRRVPSTGAPQSLIVVPEKLGKVPHKKTEVEFFASKCVANCELPPQNVTASSNPNP